MSSESKTQDWPRPVAMAIPKGGYFQDKVEQGRYGPIFPKTPACYGFSIVAKVIPGREEKFYEHARTIEKTIAEQPDALAVLKLHYLRWLLFPIKGETHSCTKAFSTLTSTNTPRTLSRCSPPLAFRQSSKISKDSLWTGRPIRRPS
jgi:hypothetical protein